jgi:hypothetical protein
MVILVTRDVLATVGPGFEDIVVEEGARIRLIAETVPEYEQRVIDDVQQRLHDEFVDTTWPTCPLHPNHPLLLGRLVAMSARRGHRSVGRTGPRQQVSAGYAYFGSREIG